MTIGDVKTILNQYHDDTKVKVAEYSQTGERELIDLGEITFQSDEDNQNSYIIVLDKKLEY